MAELSDPTLSEMFGGTVVQCPNCHSEFMHRRTVSVFNRHSEDADRGLSLSIDWRTASISDDADRNNPSSRRNGIRIDFECEQCPKVSTLVISQHKGNEFIGWSTDDN